MAVACSLIPLVESWIRKANGCIEIIEVDVGEEGIAVCVFEPASSKGAIREGHFELLILSGDVLYE